MLDEAERASAACAGAFDTRLVRARSFAEGVLETLDAERFDVLLVEKRARRRHRRRRRGPDSLPILEKAAPVVMLVRPARPE